MAGKSAGWRRTPPAVFPAILGVLGLGLAWQAAARALGMLDGLGDVIVAIGGVGLVLALSLYLAKLAARPGALPDDLRILPARAGLAAAPMALMVLAAGLVGTWPGVALGLWWAGVLMQGLVAVAVAVSLLRAAPEQRAPSAFWHLPFVGMVVAPLAGIPLGYAGFSAAVFWVSLGAALAIWAGSGLMVLRRGVPPPFRPAQVIHLAPLAVLGMVALPLGQTLLFEVAVWLSAILVVGVLLRLTWVLQGGWTPIWSGLTFPIAAFISLQYQADAVGMGQWTGLLATLSLAAASVAIPYIAAKTAQGWISGRLAAMTNAASA